MKIAILGYGTVAHGTLSALKKQKNIEVSRILVRRDIPEIEGIATRSMDEILRDPEIALVAELIGGEEPAFSFVTAAMKAGKHVVSANKQMISHHYAELLSCARENGVSFAFSAAAGGGIPWLVNLLRFSQADSVRALHGIMNGTTNFILDEMQRGGKGFDEALALAQKLGYAEADPSADIDGLDVRAKLALSVNAAAEGMLIPEEIPALGIRRIRREDIEYFRSRGLICKLIGRADLSPVTAAYVEPVLFPEESAEAGVRGASNILTAELSLGGPMRFIGGGAGEGSTGVAVAGDICDILSAGTQFSKARARSTITNDPGSVKHTYYVRMGSGIDVRVATPMEMHAAVHQAEKDGIDCFAASFAEQEGTC